MPDTEKYTPKVITETDTGFLVPEAPEIKKMTSVKVAALYEDLLNVAGSENAIEGFEKMTLSQKRESLIHSFIQLGAITDPAATTETVDTTTVEDTVKTETVVSDTGEPPPAPAASVEATGKVKGKGKGKSPPATLPGAITGKAPSPTEGKSTKDISKQILDKELGKGAPASKADQLKAAEAQLLADQGLSADTKTDTDEPAPDKDPEPDKETKGKKGKGQVPAVSPKADSSLIATTGKAVDIVKHALTAKDPVKDFSAMIEQMEDPSKIEAFVKGVHEASEVSDFMLGGALQRLQGAQEHWQGKHEKFQGYVENELNMDFRKALYLIRIYNGMIQHGIDWATFQGLTWSKIRYLRPVFHDQEALLEFVEKAKEISSHQLQAEVQAWVDAHKPPPDQLGGAATALKTKSFKLHKDQIDVVEQALEKAKEDAHTDADAVALESIAVAYTTGQLQVAPKAQGTFEPPAEGQWWDDYFGKQDTGHLDEVTKAVLRAIGNQTGDIQEAIGRVLTCADELWGDKIDMAVKFTEKGAENAGDPQSDSGEI